MFSLDVCGRQACLSYDLCKSQSPAWLITLCPVICIHEQRWCLFLNCSLTIVITSIIFLPLCRVWSLTRGLWQVSCALGMLQMLDVKWQEDFFSVKVSLYPAFWESLGMGVGFWRIAELLFAYEAEPAALTFLLRVCVVHRARCCCFSKTMVIWRNRWASSLVRTDRGYCIQPEGSATGNVLLAGHKKKIAKKGT